MSDEAGDSIRLVFDFALREGDAPTRLQFTDPVAVHAAYRVREVNAVLQAVEEAATQRGLWAAGFIAYEAASAFDSALATHPPAPGIPLVWFALFPHPSPRPRRARTSPSPSEREGGVPVEDPAALRTGVGADINQNRAGEPLPHYSAAAKDGTCTERPLPFPKGRGKSEPCEDGGRGEWNQSIAAIHQAIARGETYQVNLTRRLRPTLPSDTDTFALYEHLRTAQAGTRYAAFIATGRFQILSTSPELFFSTEGQRIITRPMKGTAKRGRWNEEDDRIAVALAKSEKERAENVMIVDLLRNDLGKIAVVGSVHVPNLFTIERYPTVFQMTSTVEATLREGIGLTDIFRAMFPCGSVTGAPKIRTMQCIQGLEQEPRGVYCGAVGIVRPGGDAVFNVAIRTLVHDAETGIAEYGVGGGITWDSTAEEEWAETEAKAAVLTNSPVRQDFDLIETLRLENGAYVLRERHLGRLADSTAYFSRAYNPADVSQALDAFARDHPEGVWRVRLRVTPDGMAAVEGTAFAFSPAEPLPVMLAQSPIDSRNVFLFHKTTRREVYEEHRQVLPEGVYDSLLWNTQGEVTEFTSANVVAEIDGVRWTPPRRSGLLGGTFRAELLETGDIQERVLTVAEVAAASRLWLINSVRGWVPVRLVEKENT